MTTSINGKSILVIDDDEAMLRALNKVLKGEGVEVTSTCNAWEAASYLTARLERFDLVITDLRMPVLGGKSILDAVGLAVPVIVITAFSNPELKAECMKSGAVGFLEKPLNTPELIAAIEYALAPSGPSFPRRPRRQGAANNARPPTSEGQIDLLDCTGGS